MKRISNDDLLKLRYSDEPGTIIEMLRRCGYKDDIAFLKFALWCVRNTEIPHIGWVTGSIIKDATLFDAISIIEDYINNRSNFESIKRAGSMAWGVYNKLESQRGNPSRVYMGYMAASIGYCVEGYHYSEWDTLLAAVNSSSCSAKAAIWYHYYVTGKCCKSGSLENILRNQSVQLRTIIDQELLYGNCL